MKNTNEWPSSRRTQTKNQLSYILQQFRCWGLLHFDVGEEFLACIFETGPKEIYHIIDDQKAIMISLADFDGNGWVLLISLLRPYLPIDETLCLFLYSL